ncbi:MAG TPA: hypothetical protein PLS51_13100, partial [Flavobacterium sp.]|nr:hypothetical protein [Flavobacterium sp.]
MLYCHSLSPMPVLSIISQPLSLLGFIRQQPYLFLLLVPVFIFILFLLLKNFTKLQLIFIRKNAGHYSRIDPQDKEYQHYLLLLGGLLPLVEIIFEVFKVREKSLLLVNSGLGLLFLALYFISKKSTLVLRNIKPFFVVAYIIYFGIISRNLIFRSFDMVPIIGFVLAFFFAYNVIKPILVYWFFVMASFVFLAVSFAFELIPFKTNVVLTNYCILVAFINFIRHIAVL